jgi:hypothetical protein
LSHALGPGGERIERRIAFRRRGVAGAAALLFTGRIPRLSALGAS